ncbi:MAG: SHOCT domain-containing protein [Bacillota bacterium]
MMFIWPLIIILIVLYFYKNENTSGRKTQIENPLEILDKRYILGEITEDEYKKKKQLIKG